MICPQCSNTDEQEFLGIEVQGTYDGVIFWSCLVCNHYFPRFSEGKLHRRALELIDDWAAARKEL